MGDERADTVRKGHTAPKGRPTRARDDRGDNRRAFGPVAQWITVAILVIVAVVILIIVTGGGDFNPFGDDGTLTGAPASALTT